MHFWLEPGGSDRLTGSWGLSGVGVSIVTIGSYLELGRIWRVWVTGAVA